jgi:stearoyl-CoA desaturase (Delta-9 desaturase)
VPETYTAPSEPREKVWLNIIFLSLTPVIGILGTAVYSWVYGFQLWMPILTLVLYLAVGMSICAGYHRFFSHKAYEGSKPVQLFYAIFGAMAAQGSILQWSSSHRYHHKYVDREWDPYNIRRGFWWAHIFWVFYKDPLAEKHDNVPDLHKNPIVRWQHRWYSSILLVGGFALPAAIGAFFGDWIAGLLWGGFLRIVIIHHTTFFVNSLAHSLGEPKYNAEVSARDNWLVALLTLGEGYHSFHHRFPADYRNGVRWYQWDPAKWFILLLRVTGLANGLRSTPAPQLEQAQTQAMLLNAERRLAAANNSVAEEARRCLTTAVSHLEEASVIWRRSLQERARGASESWRENWRELKAHVKASRKLRRRARRLLAQLPEPVSA